MAAQDHLVGPAHARARAEAALRDSQEVLSLAMRGGRMGAWSRNLVTNEVWWSRELEEIFGLPPGSFEGTHSGYLSFVHADDRGVLEGAVRQAIVDHTDYVVEFRFRHASGEWRWMDGRGRATYDAGGAAVSLYGVGIDITERKQTEQAIAAARDAAAADAAQLGIALAAARLGDWRWDAATDVVTLSPRAAELFALPPGALITWAAMRDRLHEDDRERARIAVEESIAHRTDYGIEYRVVHDGRERWVRASGRARYDAAGAAIGMLGVVEDISHDRLLVLVDDAVRPLSGAEDITYAAARVLGSYLRVNRCAYAVVESDQDTFVLTGNYTHDTHSIVGRYTFRQFGEECLRLMRRGEPYVVTDARRDPRITAEERPSYEATAIRAVICVPILKQGRFVAAMAVHALAAREWREDEVTLVQQVASRCWESLERARVERDREDLLQEAESANRAKDEFMAMLGHELRNPLSPIVTALHLMKLRGDDATLREREVIERQVAHLTRLVDDLLDVSRIARGKVDLKREVLELSAILGRAVETASPLLEERDHTLVLDVPAAGLPVNGDMARLTQVFANLLTNAAKYTAPGGRVVVSAAGRGDEVAVTVSDNGIGIAEEVLPHVFDAFLQGRQSSDRALGGLGLGLTIVRSLTERHGGTVAARSDGPGQGSAFVVTLPLAVAGSATGLSATARGRTAGVAPALRVLIVDDNRDAADLLSVALEMYGFDTRTVHDGPGALRLAASFRPDLAVLDIGLPVMDGYELAAGLREVPGLEQIRLIAVTGYGQTSDRERSATAGFDHHLVKPVDVETFVDLALRRPV